MGSLFVCALVNLELASATDRTARQTLWANCDRRLRALKDSKQPIAHAQDPFFFLSVSLNHHSAARFPHTVGDTNP